jgi:hypothetical protein
MAEQGEDGQIAPIRAKVRRDLRGAGYGIIDW